MGRFTDPFQQTRSPRLNDLVEQGSILAKLILASGGICLDKEVGPAAVDPAKIPGNKDSTIRDCPNRGEKFGRRDKGLHVRRNRDNGNGAADLVHLKLLFVMVHGHLLLACGPAQSDTTLLVAKHSLKLRDGPQICMDYIFFVHEVGGKPVNFDTARVGNYDNIGHLKDDSIIFSVGVIGGFN